MAEVGIARLFQNGRSQAVRLPRAFRLPGDRVKVRRFGRGVLLEPMTTDVQAWYAELDQLAESVGEAFMSDGPDRCRSRRQPMTPVRTLFE